MHQGNKSERNCTKRREDAMGVLLAEPSPTPWAAVKNPNRRGGGLELCAETQRAGDVKILIVNYHPRAS